ALHLHRDIRGRPPTHRRDDTRTVASTDDALGNAPRRMASRASAISEAGTAGMSITAAARAAGLSRTTLMYYERLGLIRPQSRAGSRYRSFGPADLQALFRIARWRAIGLPLETIRALLQRPA